MTEPPTSPPTIMGVPDSTGMGGLPTLGSSLPRWEGSYLRLINGGSTEAVIWPKESK